MKSARINRYGGPEVIEIVEAAKPALKKGQVLVEVRAAAINPFDRALGSGAYQKMIPVTFPMTVGADFAGVIAELGPDIAGLKVGDEVFGSAIVLNGGSGALAEFAAVNAGSLAPKANNVSFEEMASLTLVGISAFQAIDKLNLKSGQKILIQGGAGGIGSAAIQYAKYLGLYVAATVRGDDVVFVKDLGADEAVNYETQVFESVLQDYDAVFDTVGGEVYAKSFKVLKKGGTIISMVENPNEQLAKEYGVTALKQNTDEKTPALIELKKLVERHVIKPQIDRKFPLEQAASAFEHMEFGHPKGKVVISIS